jgi:ADP-heptose:LPS heptosyltransferase
MFTVAAKKEHHPRVTACSKTSPFTAKVSRHAAALRYVIRVILPIILKTFRRPVIFSRGTGMGDIICTIPAARELMKRHPGATFIYNCHPDFTAVPRLAGIADLVTSLEPIGLIGYWYHFLLEGFYHFANSDDKPGEVTSKPMVAEFLRQFNLPITDEHPHLAAGPVAQEKVKSLLARKNLDAASLVLIHPGPSWTVKEWPRENWTHLVAALREKGFTDVAQLGVGRYMNFGQVEVPVIPGAVSLVDALTLEESIAIIAQAKLFIGIDSGLLHVAACTRTPAVGIFGPTSPQFYYAESNLKNFAVSTVECAGCHHRLPRLHWITGCPHEIKCMKTLGVDEVLSLCLAKF